LLGIVIACCHLLLLFLNFSLLYVVVIFLTLWPSIVPWLFVDVRYYCSLSSLQFDSFNLILPQCLLASLQVKERKKKTQTSRSNFLRQNFNLFPLFFFFFFFFVMGKSNGSLQPPSPQKVKEALHLHIETYYFKEIWFDFFLLFFGFWRHQIKWVHLQPKQAKSNLIGNPQSI
jgi:hypothetical protein